jgi:hypothetical protein
MALCIEPMQCPVMGAADTQSRSCAARRGAVSACFTCDCAHSQLQLLYLNIFSLKCNSGIGKGGHRCGLIEVRLA